MARTALIETAPNKLQQAQPNVAAMMEKAIAMGPEGVTALRELVTLHREQQQYNASLEFAAALARFQDECPPIAKRSKATIATRSGGTFEYSYADLEEILTQVREPLRANGFSLSFDSQLDGQTLTCYGILRHVNGHSERAKMTLPTASSSSVMSEQQKVAAALTFAKRNVVISLLGLIISDPDPEAGEHETIGEERAATLAALIDETHTDMGRFLKWANAASLSDIRVSRYKDAVSHLERKRRG